MKQDIVIEGTYTKEYGVAPLGCNLALGNRTLYIYAGERKSELVIWKFEDISSCTFNGSLLAIEKHTARVECHAPEAYSIYQSIIAPPQANAAKRPLVSYTPWIVTIAAVVGVLVFAYFVFLPWLGQRLVSLFPESIEIEMGEALSKQYTAQYPLNDSADVYVNRFWKALGQPNTYPIEVRVLKSPEINAFALPGGKVFIYTGMLEKLNTYEELAALLGHEVSHVTHRHSLKTILRQVAGGIVLSTFLGDFSELSAWILSKADEFKQLDYSRELETEADDEGYVLMLKAGVNPQGMVRLLELLKKEGAEMPAMMKYLSTHPDTQARIDNVKSKTGLNARYTKNENLENLFRQLKAKI